MPARMVVRSLVAYASVVMKIRMAYFVMPLVLRSAVLMEILLGVKKPAENVSVAVKKDFMEVPVSKPASAHVLTTHAILNKGHVLILSIDYCSFNFHLFVCLHSLVDKTFESSVCCISL